MNTISVYGRLATDVESREVGGATVADFSVASRTGRVDKNTNQNITNFYRVNAWRSLADISSKYLKKGNRVVVTGDLVIRPYKDKNGVDKTAVEIDARNIDLVETKSEADAGGAAPAKPAQNFTPVETPDDLPF